MTRGEKKLQFPACCANSHAHATYKRFSDTLLVVYGCPWTSWSLPICQRFQCLTNVIPFLKGVAAWCWTSNHWPKLTLDTCNGFKLGEPQRAIHLLLNRCHDYLWLKVMAHAQPFMPTQNSELLSYWKLDHFLCIIFVIPYMTFSSFFTPFSGILYLNVKFILHR